MYKRQTAGVIGIINSWGIIKGAVGLAANELKGKGDAVESNTIRTQKDLSMKVITIGIIVSLIVTFLFFQQGFLSPVTWLLLSELFPLRIRGMGMGCAVLCLWLTNFCIGSAFPSLLYSFGLSATFFIFAAIGLLGLAFVYKFVPETRGRTLEQIEHDFRHHGEKSVHCEEKA